MRHAASAPLLAALALLLLAGCRDDETAAAPPAPVALTREAVGHFCGMLLAEHPGPKGQILLRGAEDRPVWFSSVRDAIAFAHLAEEPRSIRAIYVSDMAKAEDWDDPGATNWVEARRAHFVLGSSRRGGMGAEEAVPFSDRATAERFATLHGGRVLAFGAVPRDWALGGEAAEPAGPGPEPSRPGGEAARHAH